MGGSSPDAAPPAYQFFNVTTPAEWVAHVEVNRPEKLNAWHEPMWLEFRTVIDRLAVDPDVRAIVISGAGPKAFTSGLDVRSTVATSNSPVNKPVDEEAGFDSARKHVALQRHVLEFQACLSSVEQCMKPVAVVMHGYCYGLAIDLSSACDVRFASADAQLCVKEVDIGLAADVGTLTRLPKVCGNQGWVKDICLTARPFGPHEAQQAGFIQHVLENKEKTLEAAIGWAALVAGKSPVAVQGTKVNINYSRDHSTEDGLRFVAVWNAGMLQTTDVPAAVTAGLQKKKPTFSKL